MSYHAESLKETSRQSCRRPETVLSVVLSGGLITAGFCLCLLYLLGTQSPFVSDGGMYIPPTPSTAVGNAEGDSGNQQEHQSPQLEGQDSFNPIVLQPEDHVYRAPRAIHLRWNVTLENRSPDGVLKPVYLINGQFPGPVIEVRSGDQLVIDVHNGVNEDDHPGISIHWHGLSMEGSNEMDGVVGLTQCAIQSSQSFTYQFRIPDDQAGTFWYHAHSALQRADGLYGGLVVHRPVLGRGRGSGDQDLYRYQKEQLLLIGDWYHRRAKEVLAWFVDPDHYGLEPAPDSLLLNGRGRFNCSMAVKARPVECQDVETPIVRLANRERTRLRVINTGASAAFSMAVSNGAMELITVDGGYPVNKDTASTKAIGLLYPGERIDLVLDHSSGNNPPYLADEPPTNLTIELDRENMPLWNFALSRTQTFQMQSMDNSKSRASRDDAGQRPPVAAALNLADVSGQPAPADLGVEQQPKQLAVLYSTMKIRAANHNQPVGSLNHTSWITPDAQAQPLLSLEREEWAAIVQQPTQVHEFDVPWFRDSGANKWVDMVINNFDDKGHPFHLHGYEFYVVARAQADGTYRGYNPFDAESVSEAGPLNTRTPLRKDTVYIPPMGYVVMRLPLRNDGLWLLHCHVLWHQAVGMGTVLQVGRIPD
ncbi:hypothetical protein ED733_003469 [Metarhizium rileyi]|uniref:Laccase 1 n=1 Tax=Metarhizium rileyi (strain RCEF 4871) TaxID=1649241 RepID=A0A5C6G407_METRR|nr:hypothetical protein ED733_003469 [Metarhizium rileyi]